MQQEVIDFKRANGRVLPLIVAHFIKIGQQRAATITDEEIQQIKEKVEQEEKTAETNGKIQIITADFQCFLLKACRELALLSNRPELVQDVNLIMAEALAPQAVVSPDTPFDNLQKIYWERVIDQWVESLADDEERQTYEDLLNDDGYDTVIEQFSCDDEVWGSIYNSLEYYITHLK